jgi:hypothetical protein
MGSPRKLIILAIGLVTALGASCQGAHSSSIRRGPLDALLRLAASRRRRPSSNGRLPAILLGMPSDAFVLDVGCPRTPSTSSLEYTKAQLDFASRGILQGVRSCWEACEARIV